MSSAPIQIISFDPGSRFTGWCLLGLWSEATAGFYGTLEAEGRAMPTRVKAFMDDLLRGNFGKAEIRVIFCEKSNPPRGAAVRTANWENTAKVRGVIDSFVDFQKALDAADGSNISIQFRERAAVSVRAAFQVQRYTKEQKAAYKRAHTRCPSQDAQLKARLIEVTGASLTDCTPHEIDAIAGGFLTGQEFQMRLPWSMIGRIEDGVVPLL